MNSGTPFLHHSEMIMGEFNNAYFNQVFSNIEKVHKIWFESNLYGYYPSNWYNLTQNPFNLAKEGTVMSNAPHI